MPFRSVASRLLKSLTEQARAVYQLDVLRPPTFDRLGDMLQRATSDGQSYDVVHFDGHGAFLDMAEVLKQWREKGEKEALNTLTEKLPLDSRRFSPADLYPHQPVPGEHGYLVFENPAHTSNYRLVDGGELGRLLAACNVPVLVLNACRRRAGRRPRRSPVGRAGRHNIGESAFPSTGIRVVGPTGGRPGAGGLGGHALQRLRGHGGQVRGRSVCGAGSRPPAGRGGHAGPEAAGKRSQPQHRLQPDCAAGLDGSSRL